jgi:hypothetical protein
MPHFLKCACYEVLHSRYRKISSEICGKEFDDFSDGIIREMLGEGFPLACSSQRGKMETVTARGTPGRSGWNQAGSLNNLEPADNSEALRPGVPRAAFTQSSIHAEFRISQSACAESPE